MRSDHLSKHIKRCQNRESAAARANGSAALPNKVDDHLSGASPEANSGASQCTALDCGYSANCPQCQSDQKQLDDGHFALPAAPLLVRDAPSPTSFSLPASMFYNHFNAAASVQLAQQAVARATQPSNRPISAAGQLPSFVNGPFSVFSGQKPNDHSIDSIMFSSKPPFKSTFEPSFILNEDSSSCSSLPPQMYFS